MQFFTITAQILAHSLANLSSISRQTHEFIIYVMWKEARADNLTVYSKNKLTSVFHASVLLLLMNFVITLPK